MMPELVIRLFGEPRLSVGESPWRFSAPPKAMPLLAYLVLHRAQPIARGRLAALFWPDERDDTARANLRRHLYRLTQALPPSEQPWILSDARTVTWNPAAPLTLDVEEFERLVADPSTARMGVGAYTGDFLEGCFEDWALSERERLRARLLAALYDLGAASLANRDFFDAAVIAERILSYDEFREDALRLLMSARHDAGDRSAALAAYERFAARLMSAMRSEPMPETVALREAIIANLPASIASSAEPRTARSDLPPLVGRADDLDALASAWGRAARKSGSVVFVTGEAGIGKSRLAAELRTVVEKQGGRVLYGLTAAPESAPYQGLVDAVRHGLAYLDQRSIDSLWLSVLAPLIPEVLSLREGLVAAEPIDPSRAAGRLHEAFVRVFEAISKSRPLVLVFEDVHWAEPETIDALSALARRVGTLPILLIATYRDDEAESTLREARRALTRERRATALALARLDERGVDEIIARNPLCCDAPAELAPIAFDLSGGNPLFATQVIEGFLESGVLPDRSQGAQKIGDTIAARLDRLPADMRVVADVAATVGDAFTAEGVAAAGGWSEDYVLDGVGGLMDRRLVRESGATGFEYAFTHALIAGAIYERTPEHLRPARHRRIAQYATRTGDRSATCARHWKLAREHARAYETYLVAASESLRLHAHTDAAASAGEAAALATGARERFAALKVQVEALERRGEPAAWDRTLEILEACAAELGDAEHFFYLESRERYYAHTAERGGQRATIERMLVAANRLGDPRAQASALQAQGMFDVVAGSFKDAPAVLRRALEFATATNDRKLTARVRMNLINTLSRIGDVIGARTELDVQRRACADASIDERIDLCYAEGSFALLIENLDEIIDAGDELLRLSEQCGDIIMQGKARWLLGSAALSDRRYTDALAEFQHAVAKFEQAGQMRLLAATLINAGVVSFDLGRFDESIAATAKAAALAESVNATNLKAYALANLADAERLLGNTEVGLQHALEAYELAETTGETRLEATVCSTLAALKCEAGDVDDGVALLERALADWRDIGSKQSIANELCHVIEILHTCGGDRSGFPAYAAELAQLIDDGILLRHEARAHWAIGLAAPEFERAAWVQRATASLERELADMPEDARVTYTNIPYIQPIARELALTRARPA